MYEPPHSPFGQLFEIANCNAWTLHEVMHRIPWSTVLMMINDRSRYRKIKEEEDAKELKTQEEVIDFFHLQ